MDRLAVVASSAVIVLELQEAVIAVVIPGLQEAAIAVVIPEPPEAVIAVTIPEQAPAGSQMQAGLVQETQAAHEIVEAQRFVIVLPVVLV